MPKHGTAERRYHLGLDWGTSSTKMVLRDYGAVGAPSAMVLTPEGRAERYPSTVALDDGRLWFGWEAEARRARAALVWDSLKARAAVRNGWAESAGAEALTVADLVSLSVAHVISVGLRHAQEHAASVGAEARMAMTLGAPEPDLQVRSDAYLDVVVPAYRLARATAFDPQGQPITESLGLLDELRRDVLPKLDRTPAKRNLWLRPEVAAAMMWLYESPRVGEGPYTVVDIGAATTNASFFRIHAAHDDDGVRRTKGGLAFLGAATRPPAMDALGTALAAASGGGTTAVSIRGRERKLLRRHVHDDAVVQVLDGMHETWAKARQYAWPKAPELKHWEGLQFLVVGGGSTCPEIVKRFEQLPGYLRGKLDRYGRLADPGRPADLRRFARGASPPLYKGDPTFLLVAYGLSFHAGGLPDIALPNEVSPFQRSEFHRRFVSSEELGYDEK